MFFETQDTVKKEEYQDFLKIAGCLSNMFSNSEIPYLYYRVAEKVFCRAFHADDLSRSDVSADAKKDSLGIGLKTFLKGNNKSFQKVAEFNKDRLSYSGLDSKGLIVKVSELRNARLEFTENIHDLTKSIYHCVLRDAGKFKIFEEPMDKIDIPNLKIVKENQKSIIFTDDKNEYSFLISKSTLTKRFITESVLHEFDVEILKDPLLELKKLIDENELLLDSEINVKQTIYLPLYSHKDKKVQEKSALNSWNASQAKRRRDPNEVYIQIPSIIHKKFPTFFPDRETPFNIKLPNGVSMKSKVCSDNAKALMSCSNKELGKWILRDVLNLKEGELLTYEKLQLVGIDSVRLDKLDDLSYEINFTEVGSYEDFIENNS